MRNCGICGDQYRRPITHIKDRHRTQMWEQFFGQHPMPPNFCTICNKSIKSSLKRHALHKHFGKAAKEFSEAGGLS